MTTIKGLAVKVDGTYSDVELGDLKSFQDIVHGWIEGVTITGRCRMYVNEEGLLLDLPVNPVATTFYPYEYGIRGDVVFVGPIEGDGYDTSVPDWLRQKVIDLCDLHKAASV